MKNLPLESLLGFYAPFVARILKQVETSDVSPSARADALISALALLRMEREARLANDKDFDASAAAEEWRGRVEAIVAATKKIVDSVEVEMEQDYLRRILLTALLELSPREGAFVWESAIDALLDTIADDDERQNAIYPYTLYLASRLAFASKAELPVACAKIDRLADELQDAYEYEHAIGKMTAGAADAKTRLGVAVALTESLDDMEELDAAELKLETEDGLLRFFNESALADLDLLSESDANARLDEAYEGLKATIARVEKTIETGVRYVTYDGEVEEEELDEDETDEVRDLLVYLDVNNPRVATEGDYWREFVKRYDAFGTLERAVAATTDPVERAKWLELGAELATQDSAPVATVDRLVRIAKLEFLYGDATKAKNSVRAALGVAPKLTGSFGVGDRVDAMAKLARLHVDVKMTKPATKLLEALDAEIGKIDELLMFEHKKVDNFDLYLELFDDDRVDEVLEGFESVPARLRQTLVVEAYRAVKAYDGTEDVAALDAQLAQIVEKALENEANSDPVVAAAAFRDLAGFVSKRD